MHVYVLAGAGRREPGQSSSRLINSNRSSAGSASLAGRAGRPMESKAAASPAATGPAQLEGRVAGQAAVADSVKSTCWPARAGTGHYSASQKSYKKSE